MKIPIIKVIVDSGDRIAKKDDPKEKMLEKRYINQKLQILLKRGSLNEKRSK